MESDRLKAFGELVGRLVGFAMIMLGALEYSPFGGDPQTLIWIGLALGGLSGAAGGLNLTKRVVVGPTRPAA